MGKLLSEVAKGYATGAQLALGECARSLLGLGAHVWDTRAADPPALAFFRGLGRTEGLP